ncbi:MAG TPA: lipid-A-disaccharide synthase, partial [Candidatus Goldiibacteriota bacterium]|nr:lipid-A-disaccharide synthase [Candidatus Goldiibacteriota bacterium]
MIKIMISAGEASGDLYGAGLAAQLKKLGKDVVITGFGGDKMRKAGVDVRLDPVKHAVMGFWEAFKSLPVFLGLFSSAVSIIRKEKPDALVVIDSPGF